jgi:nucleoside-diphosphate-sugar epimerase
MVLRPRFVWGVGDTTLLPGITSMAEAGRFAWVGGGTHLTDTTHVDNVVEGLLLTAAKGRAAEAYFVTDGDRVVFREFVSAMLETQGVEPPTRSVPAAVAGPMAAAAETVWRVLRLGGEPPATRFAVWISSQECTIDISKARSELGYEPVVDRERGLAEMRDGAGAAS